MRYDGGKEHTLHAPIKTRYKDNIQDQDQYARQKITDRVLRGSANSP